ncbi:MAG: GNAT family N-acetyltransferase [Bacteroidota bacterium]|nr:GNAT family N-acetyltransferase [Bacteroidota bacterium]
MVKIQNVEITEKDILIVPCGQKHFELVKYFINKFELDNRELKAEEFLVAVSGNELLGFGRIREYADCSELCSLGIVEPYRFKHIGTELSKALINKAKSELYLVCIIPSFFERLDFSVVNEYPSALADKLSYCIGSLAVPEEYCVMKLQNA